MISSDYCIAFPMSYFFSLPAIVGLCSIPTRLGIPPRLPFRLPLSSFSFFLALNIFDIFPALDNFDKSFDRLFHDLPTLLLLSLNDPLFVLDCDSFLILSLSLLLSILLHY
jgi:hypothetical protein